MAWVYLLLAGLFEMLAVSLINKFHQLRNVRGLLYVFVAFAFSLTFLSLAMVSLPMGTAYAIWTGIGASGGAIVGILFYGESKEWKRVICIGLILAATIGLKVVS